MNGDVLQHLVSHKFPDSKSLLNMYFKTTTITTKTILNTTGKLKGYPKCSQCIYSRGKKNQS